MARPRSQYPTELELEILKVIWRNGPNNVRHVRDELAPWRDLAYTSVMTIMNIMNTKGYLRRVKEGNSFTYHAKISQSATTQKMLMDIVNRAFAGSAPAAIEAIIQSKRADDVEPQHVREVSHRKLEAVGA